jgi:hypothetical protein
MSKKNRPCKGDLTFFVLKPEIYKVCNRVLAVPDADLVEFLFTGGF